MDAYIKKAATLVEALPYIREFRGEIIVVKVGGSAMDDPVNAASVLQDVAFMSCVGMLPVIVHGGGKAINRGMKESGVETHFRDGLRVTCEKTMAVVNKVFKQEVNPEILRMLEKAGADAKAIHGEKIFKVSRMTGVHKETGDVIDWGFVGVPNEVDIKPIMRLLAKKIVPVITPLGIGPDGKMHNINADIAAGAVAKALKARKIVYISDVPGLLRDPEDESSIMATLYVSDVEELVEKGVIAGGMLPKVQSGVDALNAGVRKVHFIDGNMQHSLLLEIYTTNGVGTEILSEENLAKDD